MLKKKNIFIAIIITLFFLILAYLTTFRLAIYAFVVCYIGVIIAKSRNKRLKVPVTDFFILTFFVGIVFTLIYSYSPRLQYYEFLMLHSRWEISQVKKIEEKSAFPLKINSDIIVGKEVNTSLSFNNSQGSFIKSQTTTYFQTNIFNLINQTNQLDKWIMDDLNYYNSTMDLFIFKKPNKNVYKVFNKGKIFSNPHSETNLVFSILFLLIFLFSFFKILFNLRITISSLLNQYPKKTYIYSVLLLLYIIIYSFIIYITIN